MFGLSTQEVEMKNVQAAYQNCAMVFYEAIKNSIGGIESKNETEQNQIMIDARKDYLEASRESLFSFLRDQYPNFDSKFESTLRMVSHSFGEDEILMFKKQGFSAGALFYFVFKTISGKDPKPQNCMLLNRKMDEIMNSVFGQIDNEISVI